MRAPIVISAVLAIGLGLGLTANADTIAFSIAPVRTGEAGAFFSYSLGPGQALSDTAVVRNSSSTALTLRLYPADAVTATNGGTAFMGFGQFRDHTHMWLSTSATELTIPANGSVPVPFRITVPPDATPGDHIAGWVVEAAPQASNTAGFGAAIVQRAGVAVVVRVPGTAVAKLALGEVCINQQSGSNYLQLVAANQGSLLTKATGGLVLKRETGEEIFQRPVDIGTVLPHDSAFIRLDAPVDLTPGRFVASFRLTLSDGTASVLDAPLVIGETKTNGCAKVDAAPVPQQPTRTSAQAPQARAPGSGSTSSDPLGSALPAVIAGGVGLIIGGAAIWVLRKP